MLAPKLAILDETDSGLDVDALDVVSRGIETYREQTGGATVIITHNTRILEHLSVDRVHVMVKGRIVAEGDASLIDLIDTHGFEQFEAAAAGASSTDDTEHGEGESLTPLSSAFAVKGEAVAPSPSPVASSPSASSAPEKDAAE